MEATEDNCVTVLKSNYEIEIKVNFSNLEERYNGDKLSPVHQKVNIMNFFFGVVRIADLNFNFTHSKTIDFLIPQVDELKGKITNLTFNPQFFLVNEWNDEMVQTKVKLRNEEMDILVKNLIRHHEHPPIKLRNVEVTFEISFQACKEQIHKQTLIQGFSAITNSFSKVLTYPACTRKSTDDVKIICGETSTVFDKNILSSVSDVFRTMFENPNNLECQRGVVCLEEVNPSTILAFQRFLTNHKVEEDDLNVAMLLFADRYNIQPIVKLCLNHLKENITRENFPEIVKASDLINDKGLLRSAVNFAKENMGTFDNNSDVKKFMRANYESFMNVFEEMMFRK